MDAPGADSLEAAAAMSSAENNPLAQNAVQAIQDLYTGTGGLLAIKSFVNIDATDDSQLMPVGMVSVHDANTLVHPDSIVDFKHVMVFPISRSDGKKFTDADFTSPMIRERIQAAVPQYSDRPPSLTFRNRIDNSDIDTWDAELGQSRAHAGIYKQLAPNGRDTTYSIHVMTGAENIASELRSWVNQQPADKRLTWSDFIKSDEVSYAKATAENNAKRIGYAVARAAQVKIPHLVDEMSKVPEGSAFGKASRAEPKLSQPVSCMMRYTFPQRQAIAVYSGVTPADQCKSAFLAVGSAYDPIVQFNMVRDGSVDPMGIPALAPHRVDEDLSDKTAGEDPQERISHLLWEGNLAPSTLGQAEARTVHPDAHPNAYDSVTGEAFLDAMVEHGWTRKANYTQYVPVMVKISNPDLKRPVSLE
jgi:hypothetical protein